MQCTLLMQQFLEPIFESVLFFCCIFEIICSRFLLREENSFGHSTFNRKLVLYVHTKCGRNILRRAVPRCRKFLYHTGPHSFPAEHTSLIYVSQLPVPGCQNVPSSVGFSGMFASRFIRSADSNAIFMPEVLGPSQTIARDA